MAVQGLQRWHFQAHHAGDTFTYRFEKDGGVVHKLRLVEAYVVDDRGNRVELGLNNSAVRLRTRQVWQLQHPHK